jgi:hypothetical protein
VWCLEAVFSIGERGGVFAFFGFWGTVDAGAARTVGRGWMERMSMVVVWTWMRGGGVFFVMIRCCGNKEVVDYVYGRGVCQSAVYKARRG